MAVDETPSGGVPATSVASYAMPRHVMPSDWLEHAPFAFWLVEAIRPRTLVELGTCRGFSFLAFCQAVKDSAQQCACYAVDSWEHDASADLSGDEVFRCVSSVQQQDYPDIAKLVRTSFDAAAPTFSDGSIDLLHIDVRQNYNDIHHHYSTWAPKLSARGVVLLHHINVRDGDFGAGQLWNELASKFPSFQFIHGCGLGVVVPGPDMPARLRDLMIAGQTTGGTSAVRSAYSRLGKSIRDMLRDGIDLAQSPSTEQLPPSKASQLALSRSQRDLHEAESQLLLWRRASERYAREKYALVRQRMALPAASLPAPDPLVSWLSNWSQTHPRGSRWIWGALCGLRMLVRMQIRPLLRAMAARIRGR